MYNTELPMRADLPSAKKLLRSTVLAAVSAAAILLLIVLPAEYGVDPTGVGRFLGLTKMGQIKTQLAAEAAADTAAPSSPAQNPAAGATESKGSTATPTTTAAQASAQWRDELTFKLAPGEGKEIKLRMKEGEKAEFEWAVQGGAVNYDIHGDGGGRNISYEKGRNVPTHSSSILAAFSGNHGWYWRNRGQAEVEIVLKTRGQYSELKQVQ